MNYQKAIKNEYAAAKDETSDILYSDAYKTNPYRSVFQDRLKGVASAIRQNNQMNAGMQAVAGSNGAIDNTQNAQMVDNALGDAAVQGNAMQRENMAQQIQNLNTYHNNMAGYFANRQQARDNRFKTIFSGLTGLASTAVGNIPFGKAGSNTQN